MQRDVLSEPLRRMRPRSWQVGLQVKSSVVVLPCAHDQVHEYGAYDAYLAVVEELGDALDYDVLTYPTVKGVASERAPKRVFVVCPVPRTAVVAVAELTYMPPSPESENRGVHVALRIMDIVDVVHMALSIGLARAGEDGSLDVARVRTPAAGDMETCRALLHGLPCLGIAAGAIAAADLLDWSVVDHPVVASLHRYLALAAFVAFDRGFGVPTAPASMSVSSPPSCVRAIQSIVAVLGDALVLDETVLPAESVLALVDEACRADVGRLSEALGHASADEMYVPIGGGLCGRFTCVDECRPSRSVAQGVLVVFSAPDGSLHVFIAAFHVADFVALPDVVGQLQPITIIVPATSEAFTGLHTAVRGALIDTAAHAVARAAERAVLIRGWHELTNVGTTSDANARPLIRWAVLRAHRWPLPTLLESGLSEEIFALCAVRGGGGGGGDTKVALLARRIGRATACRCVHFSTISSSRYHLILVAPAGVGDFALYFDVGLQSTAVNILTPSKSERIDDAQVHAFIEHVIHVTVEVLLYSLYQHIDY
jgi:hypothetical protein